MLRGRMIDIRQYAASAAFGVLPQLCTQVKAYE